MRKPWRTAALLLFGAAILTGGLLGDHLLALTDTTRDNLRVYTELLTAAHDNFAESVNYKDLVYATIQGMLRTLDPHSNFLPPDDYESMRERQQSSFYGLGIYVGMRNGMLTVITPIPNTPAERLGMRAGDIISLIEGESTEEMNLDEAVRRLKGPKGTQVTITLVRPGLPDPLELTITRDVIPQETVQYVYMLNPETGYIQIRDFSRSTGAEVARALHNLKGQGMQQLILDLRNNGGGLLDQAIEVADQFVPANSKIVETRGRTPNSFNSYSSSGAYEELGLPVIVLVNGGTASAAEILSGAIQDHDVGLVLGSPTWGKGLVQTVYTLPYGAGMALTTARYYTPSGRLIQRDYSSYYDYYVFSRDEEEDGDDSETPPEPSGEPSGEPFAGTDSAEPKEQFATDLGRSVHGGGGITPDIHVTLAPPPPFNQYLLSRSAFFRFGVEHSNTHPLQDKEWTPGPEVLAAFKAWLEKEKLATTEEIVEAFAAPETVEDALLRIRFEIFNTAFGLAEGHRVLTIADSQIHAALERMPEAAALLDQRSHLEEKPKPRNERRRDRQEAP
jgi:carboxyl-terminal processing protease